MKNNRWIYWLKLFAGIVLLIILYRKINHRESILEAFLVTDWLNIVICGLLLIPNVFLAFLKWRYLLKNRFSDITDREAFGSLLFGYTLGLVTPGRLGELGRGLFFTNKNKLTVTGLNILDKLANQAVFFTLGGIALALFVFRQGVWDTEEALPFLIIGGMLIAILWVLILSPARVKKILKKISKKSAPGAKLHTLITAYDRITPKDSIAVLGLSLLWVLVITAQYHILVLAFTKVSLWESLQAVNATLLTKALLPFTFGDLGIREGIAVFFYSQFQVSPAAVFNASLLVFLINFLIPAISGIYYVFQLREMRNGQAKTASENIISTSYGYPKVAESKLKDD
jgi:uncharacterized membrane protein YbhN (UPF0104 family)